MTHASLEWRPPSGTAAERCMSAKSKNTSSAAIIKKELTRTQKGAENRSPPSKKEQKNQEYPDLPDAVAQRTYRKNDSRDEARMFV